VQLAFTLLACILLLPISIAGALLVLEKLRQPRPGKLLGLDTGKRYIRF
jgi:hypothetical protein